MFDIKGKTLDHGTVYLQKSKVNTSEFVIFISNRNIESFDGDTVTKLELYVHIRVIRTSLTSHALGVGLFQNVRNF